MSSSFTWRTRQPYRMTSGRFFSTSGCCGWPASHRSFTSWCRGRCQFHQHFRNSILIWKCKLLFSVLTVSACIFVWQGNSQKFWSQNVGEIDYRTPTTSTSASENFHHWTPWLQSRRIILLFSWESLVSLFTFLHGLESSFSSSGCKNRKQLPIQKRRLTNVSLSTPRNCTASQQTSSLSS